MFHWAIADPDAVSPVIARSIAEINLFMARNIALACALRKANVLGLSSAAVRMKTKASA